MNLLAALGSIRFPLFASLVILASGLIWTRRWALNGCERLTLAAALGCFQVYLGALAVWFLIPTKEAYIALFLAALILAGSGISELKKILARSLGRRALMAFALLTAWHILQITIIRVHSGGTSFWDWYEHYARSQFFLHAMAPDTVLGVYSIPARPPLMNALNTVVLAVCGESYSTFQVAMAVENSIVIWPMLLFLRVISKDRSRRWLLLAGAAALTPLFNWNATFSWTRHLCNFYVLMAIWFFLQDSRASQRRRPFFAFFSIALAMLVHYSAGPFVISLGIIFSLQKIMTRQWRRLWIQALVSFLVMMTWWGPCIGYFGLEPTFLSNSTVTGSSQISFVENISKTATNIYSTFIPNIINGLSGSHDEKFLTFRERNPLVELRDAWLLNCAANFFMSAGCVLGLVAAPSFLRAYRRFPPDQKSFWFWFLFISISLGILVLGQLSHYGVSGTCLQPIQILLMIWGLASIQNWHRLLYGLILLGFLADLSIGVVLHILLQSVDVLGMDIDLFESLYESHGFGNPFLMNRALKQSSHLVYLGDLWEPYRTWTIAALILGSIAWIIAILHSSSAKLNHRLIRRK